MAISLSKYDIVVHEQQHEREEQRKIRRKAAITTGIIYAIMFAIMLFLVVPAQDPPLDKLGGGGADIILGSDATGMNETFELVAAGPPFDQIQAPKEEVYTPPAPQQSTVSEQDFADSDDPDALAINKKETNKKTDNRPVTNTTQDNPKPNNEPPRKVDERTLFSKSGGGNNGTGGTNNSKGTGNTQGDQGDKNGNPNGGWTRGNGGEGGGDGGGTGPGTGPGFELGGRSAISLIQPLNTTNEGGIVVVTIEVDQEGNVISARGGVKGSTTTNSALIAQAERAAKKAKFSANPDAPEIQTGKIRFNFRLQ